MKDHIYTSQWFKDHYQLQGEYHAVADVIDEALDICGQDAIDVGCGLGLILDRLIDKGWDVIGLDGSEHARELAPLTVRPFIGHVELTEPFRGYAAPHGLVICTEVAEHLEPEYADLVVDHVVGRMAPGGRVYWTAALKGQGGLDHVNEQDPEYWIAKFAARGMTIDAMRTDYVRKRLRETVQGMHWMWHAMVFR